MNLVQKIREQMFGKQQPKRRAGSLKLRKHEVERRVKATIEANGGTFIRINWKKTMVHFLTPTHVKKAEYLSFRHR